MPANVPGIHHVTAIARDVQRTVDFYVAILGMRFIKKTVNFDVPETYHIYFGDLVGTPGSAMTFFGWPHLPWGPAGTGQVATLSFAVPASSLAFWEGRLANLGVDASRLRRFDTEVIALRDPDDILIELVGEASDARWRPWPESPVGEINQVRSFHSVCLCVRDEAPTGRFLKQTMGFREVAREPGRVRFATGGAAHTRSSTWSPGPAPRSVRRPAGPFTMSLGALSMTSTSWPGAKRWCRRPATSRR